MTAAGTPLQYVAAASVRSVLKVRTALREARSLDPYSSPAALSTDQPKVCRMGTWFAPEYVSAVALLWSEVERARQASRWSSGR